VHRTRHGDIDSTLICARARDGLSPTTTLIHSFPELKQIAYLEQF